MKANCFRSIVIVISLFARKTQRKNTVSHLKSDVPRSWLIVPPPSDYYIKESWKEFLNKTRKYTMDPYT